MTDYLTEAEQAIGERAEKATEGPWVAREGRDEWVAHDVVAVDGDGRPQARIAIGMGNWEMEVESNFDFIAHARSDVPTLLGEIERLRALLNRAADGIISPKEAIYALQESRGPQEANRPLAGAEPGAFSADSKGLPGASRGSHHGEEACEAGGQP